MFAYFQNTVIGLTDNIHFDSNGLRDQFYIEVLETPSLNETTEMFKKVAFLRYDYTTDSGIFLMRNFSVFEEMSTQSMQNKVFVVIVRDEQMPFFQRK